ncbi:MAG: TetR/AcrR family transcriptional regulator [Spirochaetia bacterium]|nr:TetR/AcrR family transcriptional regulator [Spirochaetia bacterium]
MGRKQTGVKERILFSAARLFYEQGYPLTAVQNITEDAKTTKTSFYQYYPSKEIIAKEYLKSFSRKHLSVQIKLMRKSRNAEDFIRRWLRLASHNAVNMNSFNGCPLANLSSQIPHNKMIGEAINFFYSRWLRILEIYIRIEIKKGNLSPQINPQKISENIITIYEGALISWKLSKNSKLLKNAEELIIKELQSRD